MSFWWPIGIVISRLNYTNSLAQVHFLPLSLTTFWLMLKIYYRTNNQNGLADYCIAKKNTKKTDTCQFTQHSAHLAQHIRSRSRGKRDVAKLQTIGNNDSPIFNNSEGSLSEQSKLLCTTFCISLVPSHFSKTIEYDITCASCTESPSNFFLPFPLVQKKDKDEKKTKIKRFPACKIINGAFSWNFRRAVDMRQPNVDGVFHKTFHAGLHKNPK